MVKFYAGLVISFFILVIINILWGVLNLSLWITNGLQVLLQGMNFVEGVYFSIFLKWIILADVCWLGLALVFALKRKRYKTGPQYYLKYNPIVNPIISVIIPTLNEEKNVEKVVNDYKMQKYVKYVFVIDNHSTDKTADIAERCGAKVIRKKMNTGMADSCIMGFNESLKTDANIVTLTECDGTLNGYDIKKMIPYLDNCDVVIGTRIIQVLTEKGNQNGMFNTWGNFFIGKLLQLKYFSLLHMGITPITDIGCTHRSIRRDALEKMIEDIKEYYKNNKDKDGWMLVPYLTMHAIESDLKTIEIPITFQKRLGSSKSGANKKSKGIILGLRMIWLILMS